MRPHGGNVQRPVEVREMGDGAGQAAEVVADLQGPHQEFQQQTRRQMERASQRTEGGVLQDVLHLLDFGIEPLIDHVRRVRWVEPELDDRVRGHLLFDGHVHLDLPVPGTGPFAHRPPAARAAGRSAPSPPPASV